MSKVVPLSTCGSMVRFLALWRRSWPLPDHGAPFSHLQHFHSPRNNTISRCICLHMCLNSIWVTCYSTMHGILFHLFFVRAQQCKQPCRCKGVPSGHPYDLVIYGVPLSLYLHPLEDKYTMLVASLLGYVTLRAFVATLAKNFQSLSFLSSQPARWHQFAPVIINRLPPLNPRLASQPFFLSSKLPLTDLSQ